jgi:hypothetical protein
MEKVKNFNVYLPLLRIGYRICGITFEKQCLRRRESFVGQLMKLTRSLPVRLRPV